MVIVEFDTTTKQKENIKYLSSDSRMVKHTAAAWCVGEIKSECKACGVSGWHRPQFPLCMCLVLKEERIKNSKVMIFEPKIKLDRKI